jgi:hypothetical protein
MIHRHLKPSYALIAMLLMLSACATLNVPAPQTFNQKALAAYKGVDTAVQFGTTLLSAGKISEKDAQQVHDQAVNLKLGIEIAEQVHATNPAAGEDKLAATITSLTALQGYLQARGK